MPSWHEHTVAVIMTVKNDPKFTVFDKAEAIAWVEDNTPGDARFLTTYGDLYTTPALAGRRLYLGYEPWVSSAGYEIGPRIHTLGQIYNSSSKDEACRLLIEHNFIKFRWLKSVWNDPGLA